MVHANITFIIFRTFARIPTTDYLIEGYTVTKDSDIQQDLDKYLKENKVQVIISAIVEKVLVSESFNPYSTAIEYLINEYTDQAFLGLEMVNAKKSP